MGNYKLFKVVKPATNHHNAPAYGSIASPLSL